jgi:hypothetical protein
MELQQPGLRDEVESEWRVGVLFSVFLVPVWDSGVQVFFRVILQILDHGFLGMGTCLWL